MNTEWLEWLRIAPMSQLDESLGTRERLIYNPSEQIMKETLKKEIAAIRAEIDRRNGK